MLKLKLSRTEGATATPISFPLLFGKKSVVGQNRVDEGLTIAFPGDSLIKQQHAEVKVLHPYLNVPMLKPMLVVKPVSPNSGIYMRTEQTVWRAIRGKVTLRIGDRFTFEPYQNVFTIDYTPFVVIPSLFNLTADLESIVGKLGGHCVHEWSSSVTHLVTGELKLSVKTVCALLTGRHIVSPAFFTELLSACEGKKQLPDPNDFLPPVAVINGEQISGVERTAFFPNPNRSTLFAGKTFLFGNKQNLSYLQPAVVAGGGCAKLIAEVSEEDILGNYIIINCFNGGIEEAMEDPTARQIIECYQRGHKRFARKKEIGLAAVFCSTKFFCNPDVGLKIADNPHVNGDIADKPHLNVNLKTVADNFDADNVADDNDTEADADYATADDEADSNAIDTSPQRSAISRVLGTLFGNRFM